MLLRELQALQGAAGMPATDEQLLVAADDEGLGLSLYVDRTVLGRLVERCPLRLLLAQRARYEEAHRCAARSCRRLEERFLRRRQARPEAMVAQLRAFYRLGRHAKLRHAESWR